MTIKKIFQKPLVKNILSAIAVPIFGFILLNLAFLLDFLYQTVLRRFIGIFLSLNPLTDARWIPVAMHGSFAVVIILISWPILRSKLGTLFKSVYLTVPLSVVFATIGIFLYNWPLAVYSLGGLICAGILYYLHQNKLPWLYYYTVILVAVTLAVFTLMGGEI